MGSATAESGSVAAPRAQRPSVAAGIVAEVGAMGRLFAEVAGKAVRPPYSYGPELVAQIRLVVRVAFLPLLLVAFALSFGPAGVQGSNFFGLLGAFDRMGAAWQIAVTRLFAPMTTAIVLAGVAGTAICADIGARVVREEIAALRVLGVDPIKSIVVPRAIVLGGAAIVFNTFAMVAGMLGALLVLLQHGQPIGPFISTYLNAASLAELLAAYIKVGLFGTMIAIVCCYNGLNVSGGAEGVGRAVNRAVVISFMAIALIDYVFSAFVLATNPILSVPRG